MTRRDPLLRAATKVARALADGASADARRAPPGGAAGDLFHEVDAVRQCVRTLERCQRLAGLAGLCGWPLAAERLFAEALAAAHRTRDAAARLLARHEDAGPRAPRSSPPPPSIRTTLAELRQLHDEFEHVEVDLRSGRIVARLGPVELDGVSLGPFAIELHVNRLARGRPDASCFDCVALDPNPASTNPSVTHPHVQDGQLCAGEASAAIAAALEQCRLCDAFCLARAVLQTYNPASPYVPLEEWDGVPCEDCGRTAPRDRTCYCEHCDRDYCGDCTGCCDACDGPCCRGCLERDEASDADLCPGCRAACEDCGRIAERHELEAHRGLCPRCREEQEDEPEEDAEQPTVPEEHHEAEPEPAGDPRPPESPSPAAPSAAAAHPH